MRLIGCAAILLVVLSSSASAETVRGRYTAVGFSAAGNDPIIVSARRTSVRWGRYSLDDERGTSLVCRGSCYLDFDDVLSIGGFGEMAVESRNDGISVSWTNGRYSLACHAPRTTGRAVRTCVRRLGERMAIDTFDVYGAEHTAGSVSVDGCVIDVACDLCEGDDLCASRTPIAYGDGWFEIVSRYQARRARGWQFPSLSEPFSLKTLPVYPLAIP